MSEDINTTVHTLHYIILNNGILKSNSSVYIYGLIVYVYRLIVNKINEVNISLVIVKMI